VWGAASEKGGGRPRTWCPNPGGDR